jgi:hypothetical protein
MGLNWPKEWAYKVDGKPITWKEVLEQRRNEQRLRLERIRRIDYGFIYAGWWCYIVTRKDHLQVDKKSPLAVNLMSEIPLGILPDAMFFKNWMKELAERYPRHHPKDPRRAGSFVGWFDRRAEKFFVEKPD